MEKDDSKNNWLRAKAWKRLGAICIAGGIVTTGLHLDNHYDSHDQANKLAGKPAYTASARQTPELATPTSRE